MPYFDVFSLLDIRRRNRRSRGKRKNGNSKRKHKNKTFWTLKDLWKILKSGRRQLLSKLSSLSIASLRKLDEEANKLYDSKHELYVHFMFVHYTFSSVWVAEWPPFGK